EALIESDGGRQAFATGLYASTEMFIDQLLDLYRANVLRRRVYDSLALERLLASGAISERIEPDLLDKLPGAGIGPRLTQEEFAELQRHGVFRRDVEYCEGRIRAADGEWIAADLGDERARANL